MYVNCVKKLKELFKKSFWLKNVEINDENYPNQCIGGCNRTSKSIKLTYANQKRNLCFDCFIEKNEELKNKIEETLTFLKNYINLLCFHN